VTHHTRLQLVGSLTSLLLLTPIGAAACRSSTQPQASAADSIAIRLTNELTPWLAGRAAAGAFSGVVVVARQGVPLYTAQYGQADRERGIANAPDTRFNLGSMNKTWTAVAIGQLVEQGKVDLDAPVGRYLPDIPSQAVREQVKIRHLLSHTSGLGDYLTDAFLRTRPYIERAADYLPWFINEPLAFVPGTQMRYSNGGFALLGAVIERVSGQSYWAYVTTNVLGRAGMSHAGFLDLRARPADVAVGYAQPPGAPKAFANWDMLEARSSPAGSAYASAADIVRFSRALWTGKLMSQSLVQDFTTAKVDGGRGLSYGYGFGIGTIGGWRFVGHNGGLPGGNTEFMSFTDHDIDLVVLANVDPDIATEVARQAAAAITGQAPPPPMLRFRRP
jgi:CubicO group peptidase (beta-lactamase class C family)